MGSRPPTRNGGRSRDVPRPAAGFVGVRAIDQPRPSRYVVVATRT